MSGGGGISKVINKRSTPKSIGSSKSLSMGGLKKGFDQYTDFEQDMNKKFDAGGRVNQAIANKYNIGGDTGKWMAGNYKDIGVGGTGRRGGTSRGQQEAEAEAARVEAEQQAIRQSEFDQHVASMPTYSDSMYGPGGYERNRYGTERTGYDLDAIEGYDVAQLGGEGYTLDSYKVADRADLTGYDPTKLQNMNFDPYRRNTLQDVSATSASGQASAEGALARTGGASASDRMALAAQFNRDKIAGRSQAMGKSDELEALNRYQVGNANATAQSEADRYFSEQENKGIFKDQELQTDVNRYDADTSNAAATWQAAQDTMRDRDLKTRRSDARMANTREQNQWNWDEQARRYKEQQDLYSTGQDEWKTKGQVMSGGPQR